MPATTIGQLIVEAAAVDQALTQATAESAQHAADAPKTAKGGT